MKLIILFALSLIASVTRAALVDKEATALQEFFTQSNGASWAIKTNWEDEAADPCTYHGITCVPKTIADASESCIRNAPAGTFDCSANAVTSSADQEVVVVAINVADNLLTGTLPDSIGDFDYLEYLNIGKTDFQLTGLSGVGYRSAVGAPAATANKLTGSVPSTISNLTRLKVLNLRENAFSGSFPSEVASLSNLEHLDFALCGFDGEFPDLTGITKLYFYDMHGNDFTFTFPTFLESNPLLEYLDVSNSAGASGPIPDWIGSFPDLKTILADKSFWDGELPANIGNLKNLRTLTLSGLIGSLPDSISDLPSLYWLWLTQTGVSSVPKLYAPNLAFYFIQNSPNITSDFDVNLARSPALGMVTLESSPVSGSIPADFFSNLAAMQQAYTREFIQSNWGLVSDRVAETAGVFGSTPSTANCAKIDSYEYRMACSQCAAFDSSDEATVDTCLSSYETYKYLAVMHPTMLEELRAAETAFVEELRGDSSDCAGFDDFVTEKQICDDCSGEDDPNACIVAKRLPKLQVDAHGADALTDILGTQLNAIIAANSATDGWDAITTATDFTGANCNLIPADYWWFGSFCGECGETAEFLGECVVPSYPFLGEAGRWLTADMAHFPLMYREAERALYAASDETGLDFFNVMAGTEECSTTTNFFVLGACSTCSSSVPVGWCLLDSLVSTWEKFPLIEFRATTVELSGTVPESAFASPFLMVLELQNIENLTGDVTGLSMASTMLNQLSILNTGVGGDASSLLCLPTPTVVKLVDSAFTGEVPACIGDNVNMVQLDLSGNQFSGALPDEVGTLTGLRSLSAARNQITALPSDMSGMTSLTLLDLDTNSIAMSGNDFMRAVAPLPSVSRIKAGHNQISGLFSAESIFVFGGDQLGALTDLQLQGNQLEDSCPVWLSGLASLSSIDLRDNDFSGDCGDAFATTETLRLTGNPNLYAGGLPSYLQVRQPPTFQTGPDSSGTMITECPVLTGVDLELVLDLDPAYYNYEGCRCPTGSFGDGKTCLNCLDNAECTESQIIPERGFYPYPVNTDPSEVQVLEKCFDVGRGETSCNPEALPLSEYECAVGYEDRLCSKCSDGFYLRNRECIQCEDGVAAGLTVLFIAVILLLFFSLALRSDFIMANLVLIGIFIDYVQGVTVLLAQDSFEWPKSMQALNGIVQYSTVDLSIFTCLDNGTFNPTENIYYLFVSPLMFLALAGIIYAAGVLAVRCKWVDASKYEMWGRQCFCPVLSFIGFVYVPVLAKAMRTLPCDDSVDGHSYMHFLPYEACDGDSFDVAYALSIVSVVVYGCGIPAIVFAVLYHFRGAKRNSKEADQVAFHLFRPFKPEAHYFRMSSFARRLILLLALYVFGNNTTMPFFITLVLSLSLVLQGYYMPYKRSIINVIELWQLSVTLFTLLAGVVFSSPTLSAEAEFLEVSLIVLHGFSVVLFFFAAYLITTGKEKAFSPKVRRKSFDAAFTPGSPGFDSVMAKARQEAGDSESTLSDSDYDSRSEEYA